MRLNELWFLEGYIDFELQKYRLLAYLQEVNRYFMENKLYPQMADVVVHYQDLIELRDQKQRFQERLPKRLSRVDVKNWKLIYEEIIQDDEMMAELESIVQFSIEEFRRVINSGAEIFDYVATRTHLEPIGIVPMYKKEGYALFDLSGQRSIQAYRYTTTIFEQEATRFAGLSIKYVHRWHKTITNTPERIKRELIRMTPALPTPAVFAIETSAKVPFRETFLPIAKRLLMRHLATDSPS